MEPSIIGNKVCVIGNSFGLGPSLSCGVISAKNRKNIGFNQIENFIQKIIHFYKNQAFSSQN